MIADLVIEHAKSILVPGDNTDGFGKLEILNNCSIACSDGRIIKVDTHQKVLDEVDICPSATIINARDKVVSPGFIDAHTHPVFFGTRENEFKMRAEGKSYKEISRAGGGIRYSVRQLRDASEEKLIEHTLPFLDNFIKYGTTTIEAKSGYGLSIEDEIKILHVIKHLNSIHALDLVPTFLGAHEIPDEYRNNRNKYIDLVINDMIPLVVEENLAEFCDIFCEEHVYTIDETIKILAAARDAGLKLKIHSEQLASSNATRVAAELGVISADHLDHTTDDSIAQMKKHNVVPVLLPGAVFFLGLSTYANARKMIDTGLPVAIATDFNPGSCMTESIPMMMTIACTHMNVLPEETWIATTYNSARAIDKHEYIGTLKQGFKADITIWKIKNENYLPYHFGVNHVDTIIKNGKVVFHNEN